jgi:hypothetical protein
MPSEGKKGIGKGTGLMEETIEWMDVALLSRLVMPDGQDLSTSVPTTPAGGVIKSRSFGPDRAGN